MAETTCTVVVQAPAASEDQYAAVSLVFGAALCMLVFVWGTKQVLRLFNRAPES